MSYKWTDGAQQDAPAMRHRMPTQEAIVTFIGDGLTCATLVRSRFPRIESDARAERILADMHAQGDLARTFRGGRIFYRVPGPMPAPTPVAYPARKVPPAHRRNGALSYFSLAIMSVLSQHPWSSLEYIASTINSDKWDTSRKLRKLMNSGRVKRRGSRLRFEYALDTTQET